MKYSYSKKSLHSCNKNILRLLESHFLLPVCRCIMQQVATQTASYVSANHNPESRSGETMDVFQEYNCEPRLHKAQCVRTATASNFQDEVLRPAAPFYLLQSGFGWFRFACGRRLQRGSQRCVSGTALSDWRVPSLPL